MNRPLNAARRPGLRGGRRDGQARATRSTSSPTWRAPPGTWNTRSKGSTRPPRTRSGSRPTSSGSPQGRPRRRRGRGPAHLRGRHRGRARRGPRQAPVARARRRARWPNSGSTADKGKKQVELPPTARSRSRSRRSRSTRRCALHQGHVRLSGAADPAEFDDVRYFTFRVKPATPVLVVSDQADRRRVHRRRDRPRPEDPAAGDAAAVPGRPGV